MTDRHKDQGDDATHTHLLSLNEKLCEGLHSGAATLQDTQAVETQGEKERKAC